MVEQKSINWEELELSGYESFNNFIRLLLEREPKSASVVLEMFRGQKEEKWVKKLAFMDLSIPAEGVGVELSDALDRLIAQARKEGVAKLLAKKESGELAQDERSRLKIMLANLTKS